MPLNGFKSVSIPEEAYRIAESLVKNGLATSLSNAFDLSVAWYFKQKEPMVKEIEAVKKKYAT